MRAPLLIAAALLPGVALAHQMGLSFSDVVIDGQAVAVSWEARAAELHDALPLDADGDGLITDVEVAARAEAICAWTAQRIEVHAPEGECPCTFDRALLRDGIVVVVKGLCRCAEAPRTLRLWSAIPPDLGEGHRHFVNFHFGSELRQGAVEGLEGWADARSEDATGTGATAQSWLGTVVRFVAFGVEHIFTGYDHLCFLLGLLLVAGSLARLLTIVTAFTVAHSLTLVAAALDLVAPPAHVVEAAIALSIVYIAIENLTVHEARRRWLVAGLFGLIHGFGFAGVLRELDLPRQHLLASLVSFNLGVELGQAVIAALAFPLLLRARKSARYPTGMRACSAGILLLGLWWFVERALL